tara:strand:+ start:10367 stop:11017 length:651 start_codon:yes stop_codon:yes gene_type:complete
MGVRVTNVVIATTNNTLDSATTTTSASPQPVKTAQKKRKNKPALCSLSMPKKTVTQANRSASPPNSQPKNGVIANPLRAPKQRTPPHFALTASTTTVTENTINSIKTAPPFANLTAPGHATQEIQRPAIEGSVNSEHRPAIKTVKATAPVRMRCSHKKKNVTEKTTTATALSMKTQQAVHVTKKARRVLAMVDLMEPSTKEFVHLACKLVPRQPMA